VNVRRRSRDLPATPTSGKVSYDCDDCAVIQYGGTSGDNGVTSCIGHQQCYQNVVSPTLRRLPVDDKSTTTPTSITGRRPQSVSGPPCFQDGGQCPLDAAGNHCRRCSAAIRAISQSVFCNRRPPCPGDVTSGSDVTSATSGVSHVSGEIERAHDTADNGQNEQQPPDYTTSNRNQ